MAHIITLPVIADERGSLCVIEKILPFQIKRIYYIYGVSSKRGGHRHKETIQALVSINGKCEIFINDGITQETYTLDSPNKLLILEPKDWHSMDKFSRDCVLLVMASKEYDRYDYITKEY